MTLNPSNSSNLEQLALNWLKKPRSGTNNNPVVKNVSYIMSKLFSLWKIISNACEHFDVMRNVPIIETTLYRPTFLQTDQTAHIIRSWRQKITVQLRSGVDMSTFSETQTHHFMDPIQPKLQCKFSLTQPNLLSEKWILSNTLYNWI